MKNAVNYFKDKLSKKKPVLPKQYEGEEAIPFPIYQGVRKPFKK